MSRALGEHLATQLKHLDHLGILRREPLIAGRNGAVITIGGRTYVDFTSSDYLKLAGHVEVREAAVDAVKHWGVGLSGPRITASTVLHTQLEQAISDFLRADDALTFPSGYDANAGLFESLLSNRDYVFADEQIGPGLTDGLRLARARVYTYRHQDLGHLEDLLKRSRAARFRVVVTEGVFAISGLVAQLPELHALAARYDALVVVDDSYGLGVLGDSGRGSHSHHGLSEVQVVTGTFGHALSGGAGGFIAGRNEVITWLRQKSRPYLSSVALAPPAAAAAIKAIELLRRSSAVRVQLRENVRFLRARLADRGLWTNEGEHPVVSVLVRRSLAAQQLVDRLFEAGFFINGFSPPIVPEGGARVRLQVTVGHSQSQLAEAVDTLHAAAGELHLELARPVP
jgi:glycine C-acetyltransferase